MKTSDWDTSFSYFAALKDFGDLYVSRESLGIGVEER